MGKGDARRPTQVDDATHQERWDKAFGAPQVRCNGPYRRTLYGMECRCGHTDKVMRPHWENEDE